MPYILGKLLIFLQFFQKDANKNAMKLKKQDCFTQGGVTIGFLLIVEFKEVLYVSKDDMLLVDNSWRNLLHPTGHLPQVGLQGSRQVQSHKNQ